MALPLLSAKQSIKNKRIFVRVDWNIPLSKHVSHTESLKVSRSIETLRSLAARGAVVIAATHLGKPKKRDRALSTKQLVHYIAIHHGIHLEFLGDELDTVNGLASAKQKIVKAKAGTIFLLENVRFNKGEEENAPTLAKAYASLADFYINDAFAESHRSQSSVVAITKYLPHFAGPALISEIQHLEHLIKKPKKPFMVVMGGSKLTTKLGVLDALLKTADVVMLGGAMSTAFFAAQKKQIGKSFVEKAGIPLAKKLLKNPKIRLPLDVVVATKLANGAKPRVCRPNEIKKTEMIGDIGPETMRAWSTELKKAKTIIWNGTLGVAEIPTFSHGSLVIARAIATQSKGSTYGVVGGGDALAAAFAGGMSEWYDYLSTGGGALLTYLSTKGKLPGIVALQKN